MARPTGQASAQNPPLEFKVKNGSGITFAGNGATFDSHGRVLTLGTGVGGGLVLGGKIWHGMNGMAGITSTDLWLGALATARSIAALSC